MHIIDVNTSFGKAVDPDPRYSLETLRTELDQHQVACALSFSRRGVAYNYHAGNMETLAAHRQIPWIIPVATLDPRDALGANNTEWKRCAEQGIRAVRFFPEEQGWSLTSAQFERILQNMRGSGACAMFSAWDGNRWQTPRQIAQISASAGVTVILLDTHYSNIQEVIAVMQKYPHIYAETNLLATVGSVDAMVREVGAGRLLYGSGAPSRPMQKALNEVLEADITGAQKAAILGENAQRLLGIPAQVLVGRPQANDLSPKGFGNQEIVDVHSHLGFWGFCIPVEDYDPAGMLSRMKRFGITRSVLSSYESMRYDLQAGNRAIAAAIQGHPELLGYVEVDPHHLEMSCAEMDRYYAMPNFGGAEIELTHVPCPTGSPKVQALMAEIARRGKPVLFMPHSAADAGAERELGRQNPGLTILHAHAFDRDWAKVVADTPNICVEFCYSRPSHHQLRDAIDILGPERVLFGSDQTLLSVGAAIGHYLDANMTPEERRLVLCDNARRIFKL